MPCLRGGHAVADDSGFGRIFDLHGVGKLQIAAAAECADNNICGNDLMAFCILDLDSLVGNADDLGACKLLDVVLLEQTVNAYGSVTSTGNLLRQLYSARIKQRLRTA